MRKKILLPTDFSKNSWHAINYATELYRNEDCDFYLLNVFTSDGNIMEELLNMEPGSELYVRKKEISEKGLDKILDELLLRKESDSKHQFKTISTFNNTIEAIKQVVEDKDIEMIVMGTRGETNSKKIVFGSTAVYVMEKVRNCPVIVVPEDAKHILPKEIVFPTSYKTHYKRRELNYLIDIAKKCNATIAVLHVSDGDGLDENQKAHQALLQEIFEDVKYTYHTLPHYKVEPAINMFVESRSSDMVAFINKKHTFFASILTQPMVKNITYHSKVPILVMHDLRN